MAHRLPPQCKLVGPCAFVLVVVATPREQVWAFGVYAVPARAVAARARSRPGSASAGWSIEVPFVLFAVLMPFVAPGDRVGSLGVGLSRSRAVGAWNILAKGTLGVIASILLAATHRAPRAAARPGAAAAAAAAGADRHVHAALRRRGRRRAAADARSPGRPAASSPATSGTGPVLARSARGAVPALVRARRAGLPGDGAAADTPARMPAHRDDPRPATAQWALAAALPVPAAVAAERWSRHDR